MLHLLTTPDAVRSVSWKQLHEWVQQYPYSQHLRLIAARKAKLENNIDLQILLELAATYAPSRRFLYEYLSNTSNTPIPKNMYHTYDDEPVQPEIEGDDDALSLENVNVEVENANVEVENANVEVENSNVEVENSNVEVENANVEVENANVEVENANVEVENANVEVENANVEVENANVEIENANVEVENTNVEVENTNVEVENTLPSAETGSFGDWLALLGGIAITPTAPATVVVPLPVPEDEHEDLEDLNAENEVRGLAQRSVETNHDIISETLAKLLEIQGKAQKAIEMYAQLSLKHPEKASVFAEKIAMLKTKIG
jgi:chromosome segregation ATPase